MGKRTLKSLAEGAALSVSFLALTAGAPALAQDDAASERDEIVVSARRREESLIDVPAAVTAKTGEELELVGAQDITFLTQATPNTTLKISRGTNNTLTAFIRGIGQQDPVAGFEAGVGLYLDDVYLNRPQTAVLDIYDVERIEVLRGPQGTLYGRNTIGGALKYVTRRLGDDPLLRIRASGGTYGQREIVATAELPVTDIFAVGGTVAYLAREGYGENLTTGLENYDKDVLAFRASAELDTGNLFVRLSGDYLKDNSNPKGGHRLIPSLLTAAPVLPDVYDSRGGMTGPNEAEAYGGTLLVELSLNDEWTIKNIAAYRRDDNIQQIDFDALPSIDVDVPVIYENEQWTEEFQILYEGEALAGVLGFFYIDANAFDFFDVRLSTILPGLNANTQGDIGTKSWSVFGDLTFDLGNIFGWHGLELAVGGRYTEDERSAVVLRRTMLGNGELFGGTPFVLATTSNFTGSETFTDFSPRASLAYSPNEDHTIYVSYAQGFKGGSFDPRGQTTTVTNGAGLDVDGDGVAGTPADVHSFMLFEPEAVDTYEIGWKARFAEGRIASNMAFFYSDYKDVQIPGSQGAIDPITMLPTFVGVTTNAGKAEIYGFEWEGTAHVAEDLFGAGDSLDFGWGGGWIHAEYKEFFVSVGGVLTNIAGIRDVQNTPDFSGALTMTYTHPVGSGDLQWITTGSYKSRTQIFEFADEFIDQGGYGLLDSSLVWTSEDGRIQVGVHGKNLLDKQYRIAGYEFMRLNPDGTPVVPLVSTLGLEGVVTAFYGAPRTVTGTVQVEF